MASRAKDWLDQAYRDLDHARLFDKLRGLSGQDIGHDSVGTNALRVGHNHLVSPAGTLGNHALFVDEIGHLSIAA